MFYIIRKFARCEWLEWTHNQIGTFCKVMLTDFREHSIWTHVTCRWANECWRRVSLNMAALCSWKGINSAHLFKKKVICSLSCRLLFIPLDGQWRVHETRSECMEQSATPLVFSGGNSCLWLTMKEDNRTRQQATHSSSLNDKSKNSAVRLDRNGHCNEKKTSRQSLVNRNRDCLESMHESWIELMNWLDPR